MEYTFNYSIIIYFNFFTTFLLLHYIIFTILYYFYILIIISIIMFLYFFALFIIATAKEEISYFLDFWLVFLFYSFISFMHFSSCFSHIWHNSTCKNIKKIAIINLSNKKDWILFVCLDQAFLMVELRKAKNFFTSDLIDLFYWMCVLICFLILEIVF